ncbi:MAG: FAD-binding oxidoreductase [Euryarchaeota archaeon]|nr:FAD-binding oxidoreductase [Euryarchaeota archaeon]
MKFTAEIGGIIPRTPDVKSFRFERPDGFDYMPGQYILVTLQIQGTDVRKPFTISSSPTEQDHIEFTKKLTGHDFSNVLDSMKVGDVVGIAGPYGNFTFEGQFDKIAMVSGGIGITPMISICTYCTDRGLDSDIVLLESNREECDIPFGEHLETLLQRNPHLRVVHTLTRASDAWSGCRGRVCENMIREEIPDYKDRIFYLCGPPPMMDSIQSILIEMDIPKDRIKKEVFVQV